MSFTAIRKVNNTTWSFQPSVYDISLNDVSDQATGRTANGDMIKNRLGTCAKLTLQWNNVSGTVAQQILAAFQKNYVTIEFYNIRSCLYRTATFYIGDRSARCYNATQDIWTIAFNAIEKTPVVDNP